MNYLKLASINWTEVSLYMINYLASITDSSVSGKIAVINNTTNRPNFNNKIDWLYHWGNVDDENNNLHITYYSTPIAAIEIKGSQYIYSTGEHTFYLQYALPICTETADGAMDLAITVGWYTDYPDDLNATMPINVTFKGQRDAGVNVVEASGAAVRGAEGAIAVDGFAGRVNVYTVDGRLAASAQIDGEATITVAAGLYVVRAGEKTVKVVVK